jgi:hypothetical protein
MYIFCYSFNQNGNYIDKNVLRHIDETINKSNIIPDILVLGFQETRYGFEYYWHDLNLKKKYSLIHKIRLNGIGNVGIRGLGLYILKNISIDDYVEFKEENWVRFNYQYFGKGAVSVVISINETRFLFINTHLPYHETWDGGGIKERVDSLNVIFDYIISKTKYDHIFILGDFNFRIHLKTKNRYASIITEDDPNLFELYLRNKSWRLLYFNDELYLLNYFYSNYLTNLKSDIKHGAEYGYILDIPLLPFYRHMIDKFNFPPTYKVYNNRTTIQNPQEDKLDIDSFYARWNTDRIPSWCDRILCIENYNVKRILYESDDSILINNSDHLPVYALFLVHL